MQTHMHTVEDDGMYHTQVSAYLPWGGANQSGCDDYWFWENLSANILRPGVSL